MITSREGHGLNWPDGTPQASLEIETGEVELVAALDRSERDRKVLNCEARRVEDRHLLVVAPSLGVAGEDCAELRDVFSLELPGLRRMDELPVVACLLPVVAGDDRAV